MTDDAAGWAGGPLRTGVPAGSEVTVRGTVLVVDDEPKIREVLRGYLESEGFVVGEAADG